MGIRLRFGSEVLEVVGVDPCAQHVTLRRNPEENTVDPTFDWVTFHEETVGRYRYQGVAMSGKMDLLDEVWPTDKVKDRLTLYLRDFYPDFEGHVSTESHHWCVTNGQQWATLRRWKHSEFSAWTGVYTPSRPPPPRYEGAKCALTSVGFAGMPLSWLAGMIQTYMGMIADPLAWNDVTRLVMGRNLLVQEVVLKEDG